MRARYLKDDNRVMLETDDGAAVVLLFIDDFYGLFGQVLANALVEKGLI